MKAHIPKNDEEKQEIGISLFDVNRQIISQKQTALDEEQLNCIAKDYIAPYLSKNYDNYYMCLSNERHDYTVYKNETNNFGAIAADIIDLLLSRGKIVEFNEENEEAIELWIKTEDDDLPFVYYIFPYGQAVIEI